MRLSVEIMQFAKRCSNPDNYFLNSLLAYVSCLSIYTASRHLFYATDIVVTQQQRQDILCEDPTIIRNGNNYRNGVFGFVTTINNTQ